MESRNEPKATWKIDAVITRSLRPKHTDICQEVFKKHVVIISYRWESVGLSQGHRATTEPLLGITNDTKYKPCERKGYYSFPSRWHIWMGKADDTKYKPRERLLQSPPPCWHIWMGKAEVILHPCLQVKGKEGLVHTRLASSWAHSGFYPHTLQTCSGRRQEVARWKDLAYLHRLLLLTVQAQSAFPNI